MKPQTQRKNDSMRNGASNAEKGLAIWSFCRDSMRELFTGDLWDEFGERPVVAEGERQERDKCDGENEQEPEIDGENPAQRGRWFHFVTFAASRSRAS